MIRRLAFLWMPMWFVLWFACGTEPPPVMDPPVMDPPVLPPPVEPNERVVVSGRVVQLDAYLRGDDLGIDGAAISALGAYGVAPMTSGAGGAYEISVPQNGQLIFALQKQSYLTSYETVAIGDRDLEGRTSYLAPEPYIAAIASAAGVSAAGYGVIVGRILDDGTEQNGVPAPIAGAKADGFTVQGATVRGPYFLTASGLPDGALTESVRELGADARYRGGLFVLFVEVAGESSDLTVQIERTAPDGSTYYYGPTEVKVFGGAFSWTVVSESGRNQAPPPPQFVDVDFDSQIYPLFLSVPEGGLGCQGCHTSYNGAAPAAGMDLYGGPERAYAALDPARYPLRVNVADPEASYLLKKPLYEAGAQDHPIIAFLSTNDPGYRLIAAWIGQGAQRNNVVLAPVSFYDDILPLLALPYDQGGIGCYVCHVDAANNANNAPGRLYMGGDPLDLFYELTEDDAQDNGGTGEPYLVNRIGLPARSLLLINPLLGNPEPHPVKLLQGVDDPRYQLLYRWISEGYRNDTPP